MTRLPAVTGPTILQILRLCGAWCLMLDQTGTMRATLSIDDDVLATVKAIARQQNKSIGEVVSELVRNALRRAQAVSESRNGVPLLPLSDPQTVVTLERVNDLRDSPP